MIDKLLFEYKKKYKSKYSTKTESHSLSKKRKNNETNLSETKKHKQINKNLHKRNILFNNKQSIINLKSTSTSSLSSSAEKKYLTPKKYNLQNCDNDYYFNESYNKTQELFNIANISRPKLDYNSGHKKNKNLLLTIGTRINTCNNNFNNNNFWKSKDFNVNRSFKASKNKNKYVICRKNNFSNSNRRTNEDEKDIESKSVENYHNIQNNNNYEGNLIKYLDIQKSINNFNEIKCNNSSIKEKCFLNEENNDNNNENKTCNIKSFNKERKYKNIVLRPHKIQKENQLKYNNIKVNNYKIDDGSPKIINRLNIKPKYSRVFKYK